MFEVALLVGRVEGLEPFARECPVEHGERSRPLRTFLDGIGLVHEDPDHTRERFRGRVGRRLWLLEDLVQRVGHSPVPRRPVVRKVGIAILEELSQPAAAAVRKERARVLIPADHVGDLQEGSPPELHLPIRRSRCWTDGYDSH
jgi:hypothetical protein